MVIGRALGLDRMSRRRTDARCWWHLVLTIIKVFFFFQYGQSNFFSIKRMKLETLAGQASDLLYTYDIYTHMIYMYIYVYIHFAFIFYFETGSYQVAQVGLELIVYYHSNLTMLIK